MEPTACHGLLASMHSSSPVGSKMTPLAAASAKLVLLLMLLDFHQRNAILRQLCCAHLQGCCFLYGVHL